MQKIQIHNGEGLENDALPIEPPTGFEETLLKQLFSENPEQGFTYLFKRYYSVLCQHAFRSIQDEELAYDLVADVFTHFWQHENYCKTGICYCAYLFRGGAL